MFLFIDCCLVSGETVIKLSALRCILSRGHSSLLLRPRYMYFLAFVIHFFSAVLFIHSFIFMYFVLTFRFSRIFGMFYHFLNFFLSFRRIYGESVFMALTDADPDMCLFTLRATYGYCSHWVVYCVYFHLEAGGGGITKPERQS